MTTIIHTRYDNEAEPTEPGVSRTERDQSVPGNRGSEAPATTGHRRTFS
ncbi:MAG: hypothetical protein R2755_21470 [Acidimicrobiales bacterium]